ncbi:Isoleucyl-tRNA synthetase [Jatrophihabitans endophyticus]|uniref:Isoleucine--tRNA ligase n=1 Tax=Jatrophihabitans endophyticus TaxID=1206085 RepID=A0A1M5LBK3_9ACTN|nr:isoleucine--tRNA ligase [Jatrophihabitans endophyticus]SHG62099.1 Isoleucyl-tRNA synthetase [Jatrophihabitans endophyticus]
MTTTPERPGYRPLTPHVDLPALDREVIAGWRERTVFERSLDATADGPAWTFYEGPPTANGMPGTHHVEARVFKDVFPRWRTMKGYHVPRQAGWDCHGLPVELAVEKELGFTGKPDIENYGIAEFNAACRENVQRHVDAFLAMSERMGYWADYDNAYWTMTPDYVESVWWALKTIYDKGLLVEDFRVAPYCPRCGTGLSDHEVAQGYEDVTDPSVYVRFPVRAGGLAERHPGVALLIWTTTPWTLVSNTAAAVNPGVEYVVARAADGGPVVVAAALRAKVLGDDAEVLETVAGTDLVGTPYARPFDWVDFGDTDAAVHTVLAADFVTTDDGTGVVHEAPAFGAEDFALCRANGLPIVNPVEADGHFAAELPVVGGQFFKDADETIVRELTQRGLLFRHVAYEHSYPHCWRCHTPLMYYALPSWYIRTTAVKDELLAQNEATNWFPATIKHGRYGDWLDNNIDWALSRDRYWGTPLPVWRNDADPGREICVGSLAELQQLSGVELTDPHRPFVDDVTFTVAGQEGTYRRVPQVIDAWFDSGSMPFAQFGAPYRNADAAKAAYPADFICEAIDQTRGWFYSLMAVGTLVFEQSSYRNVVCLGHILAEDGRKMSKHLGNILEPIPLMDRHGADALRWFMLCSGSPWSSRRVGHKALEEIASKVVRTYWSVASFQSLYARANDWTPGGATGEPTVLDRWALSEVHRVAGEVDDALERFDTARAGKALAAYVDDLSNWYVRRSRRRFWDGDDAALATLHECLDVLTRLLAPFVPFVTEQVWQALYAATGAVDSVHLATWPEQDAAQVDATLAEQVALVRRLVELGRSARADSKVRTRQPLGQALISAPGWAALPAGLQDQVRDELNVVELADLGDTGELVQLSVKANFRELGRAFGKRTQAVANAIHAADADAFVAAYRAGTASVELDGETLPIAGEMVVVAETPRSGWAVASDGSDTVALDLELTHELRLAGLFREIVRTVQDARKNAGLDVTDRIELWWRVGGSPDPAEAIRRHADQFAREVLATTLTEGEPDEDAHRVEDAELGLTVWLRRAAT